MSKRIFIIGCSGFLLRNILPLLNSDYQITLLFFSNTKKEGELYFHELLYHLNINNINSNNYRIINGNILLPYLGLERLEDIDSDYWLIGAIPFKFGIVREESINSAIMFTQNIIQTICAYHKKIENINHCVFISSIYVMNFETLKLEEEAINDNTYYGNYDYCRKTIEKSISNFINSNKFPNTSIIRTGLGLSPTSNQVGGIINVICKKLYQKSFNQLVLRGNTKLYFSDIHQINSAFVKILLSKPTYNLVFYNAFDNEVNITLFDFIEVFNHVSNRKIKLLDTEHYTSKQSETELITNIFFKETLGFFLLSKYNDFKISRNNVIEHIGSDWINSSYDDKMKIILKVVENSYINNFKINNLVLGPMPIY